MITLEICDEQSVLQNDHQHWQSIIQRMVADAGFQVGSVSVAVIDDRSIHELNRQHLNHDYPTDVLSFVFEREHGRLEGEVIVSYETAVSRAAEFGHSGERELLLYVIHGVLHLLGYNDKMESDQAQMREREAFYLSFST